MPTTITMIVTTGSITRYHAFNILGNLKNFAPTAECSINLSQNFVPTNRDMITAPIGRVTSIARKSMNVNKSMPRGLMLAHTVVDKIVGSDNINNITVNISKDFFLDNEKVSAITDEAPSYNRSVEWYV